MSHKDMLSKLGRIHQRLNGSTIEYDLTPYCDALRGIDDLKTEIEKLSDDQLRSRSLRLKQTSEVGLPLGPIGQGLGQERFVCVQEPMCPSPTSPSRITEAFALVREAAWRALRLEPFDEQMIGGLVMHQGKLAEMQTGEGKTLAAVFPAYLNALTGRGVHVLTFNDYLARRDAQWMGPVYQMLGLSVGFVQEGMAIADRQRACRADITYLTAKEAGFDYLRDSLVYSPADIVQRAFHYAIVDEADSILIDEARVPLVIAAAADDYVANSARMAQIARQLEEEIHFEFDEYSRNIQLTERGLKHVECVLQCGNLYDEVNFELLTRLNCALHAECLLQRDVDYIVRKGKIELVDEFTGRIADKRRWPDGLQAAIEAKENIAVQSKGAILNSITLQHFLQLYPKISGMTATAQMAEREFREFYGLQIVVIPPHKRCIRKDHQDILLPTRAAKQNMLVKEILQVHETKRPILVGTRSVAESAQLAEALQERGVECEVLNAKRDEYEAGIVAQAGRLGAVTISTNMAGRGTDIVLGGGDPQEKEQVTALGGFYVIGTNRHESLRIDNQLRGRSGRQGDPGSSRFIISMEDDLFEKYRLRDLLPSSYDHDLPEGQIENPLVTREIRRVQRIIEGQNLEIKKTSCTYSNLIEQQRKIIVEKRKEILHGQSLGDSYRLHSPEQFNQLASQVGTARLNDICRKVSLHCIDEAWSRYLAEVADIREGIHLTRLGGKEPSFEFQKLVIDLFDDLQETIEVEAIRTFDTLKVEAQTIDLAGAGLKTPASTWTYLVNDNQFEDMLAMNLVGNIGLSAGAALYAPLLAVYHLLKMRRRRRRERVSG